MNRNILVIIALIIMVVVTGCKTKPAKNYSAPLPPGQVALQKITDPAQIPDFTSGCANLKEMENAIDNSLNYFTHASSQHYFPYLDITHDRAIQSLQAFKELVQRGGTMTPGQMNQEIRTRFDVYRSVGCDGQGTVLFTGYYTPILDGSLTQTDVFRYPLYKKPADLQKSPDGAILTPHPPRAQLEASGQLKGLELVWLKDPFEVYISHVQGSALIRMPDGQLLTAGYSANNGHEYASIGQEMIKDKKIANNDLSLASMIDFFKKNPDQLQTYLNRNPRFVFFELTDTMPRGSLNTPVIGYRTIATDKAVYPRGCLAFIKTHLPVLYGFKIETNPYNGFALDQDTGGAIRAPGRCDVYMGQGKIAENLAGRTYQEGSIYYLFLK